MAQEDSVAELACETPFFMENVKTHRNPIRLVLVLLFASSFGSLYAQEKSPRLPNFDSRLRKRSEKFGGWRHLRPLEHITHFTPATLRDAFTRAGLEPVAVGSPSYAGPPQTLDEALDDLVRARWRPGLAILPKPLAWRAVRAFDRHDDRRDAGMVVFGVARVRG